MRPFYSAKGHQVQVVPQSVLVMYSVRVDVWYRLSVTSTVVATPMGFTFNVHIPIDFSAKLRIF